MSYRFAFRQDGALLIVVFEGQISPEEERQALNDVASAPGFSPDAAVLVDRRNAEMMVDARDVAPQLDLAEAHFQTPNKPKMAFVVSSDYDYGMCRMLELTASARGAPHEIRVWRSLEQACGWLGLEPDEIQWP